MPRNPNKRRCEEPGCRNWAMRDNVFCRPHLDHVLGPRGAGAPYGNLNALKHAKHIHPDTLKQIHKLAHKLYEDPSILQEEILDYLDFFYNHGNGETVPRTLKAMVALNVVLEALIDAHAEVHFHADVNEILSYISPERVPGIQRRLYELSVRHRSYNRVIEIRKAKRDLIARYGANPQLPVHPSPLE